MQIFSYKELDKQILITLFGKNFYIQKPVERMKKVLANSSYHQILSSWKRYGASRPLMNRLEFLSLSPEAWEFEYKRIWLIYACCLFEHGKEKDAASIIDKYLHRFEPNNIAYFLPVANWCYLNGYKNIPYLENAYSMFNMLEENRKSETFQNKLKKAKRIAVVGSGASEAGKKKGSEIDGHDIVIRFNNFETAGFEEDYGKKTDIWVRHSMWRGAENYHTVDFSYGMFRQDIWHLNFPISTFQTFSEREREKEVSFGYFDYALTQSAYKLIPDFFHFPTTGALTLYILYQIMGGSDKIDCYGFSFLENNNEWKHYFQKGCIKYQSCRLADSYLEHNRNEEVNILRKLYTK